MALKVYDGEPGIAGVMRVAKESWEFGGWMLGFWVVQWVDGCMYLGLKPLSPRLPGDRVYPFILVYCNPI